MTDLQSLLRLQTWLSPAFPTGAFSYSHGLEQAIADGHVRDKVGLSQWLTALLSHGAGWNDAVLLAQSWQAAEDDGQLLEIAELATAMSISKERHLETIAQGSAFLKAAKAWQTHAVLPEDCPLPVAVGTIAAGQQVPLNAVLTAYLHAYISNQVQAALRLMKLGQQAGVEILAELEPTIIETADKAAEADLSDLGSAAFVADIMAMNHENLQSRIFRS